MQFLQALYALTKRNVILRYKHSLIGFLWGFVKPILYLFIFIVIFSAQFSSTDRYVLYTMSGLIFWFFFSNLSAQGTQSVISASGIIKSIRIPTILFPLAECLAELFHFLLALFIFFIVMQWFGLNWSPVLFWTIPILLIFVCFSLGWTLILSALHVYFRDVGILWNTIQPALFYLTPIAYTKELIPLKFQYIIRLNPLFDLMQLARAPLYDGIAPNPELLVHCTLLSVCSLLAGIFIFQSLRNQFITAI